MGPSATPTSAATWPPSSSLQPLGRLLAGERHHHFLLTGRHLVLPASLQRWSQSRRAHAPAQASIRSVSEPPGANAGLFALNRALSNRHASFVPINATLVISQRCQDGGPIRSATAAFSNTALRNGPCQVKRRPLSVPQQGGVSSYLPGNVAVRQPLKSQD
jgi:hypothetical protein